MSGRGDGHLKKPAGAGARGGPAWLFVLAAVFGLGLVVLVVSSLTRPALPSYEPTPISPRPRPDGLVVDTVTVDARDSRRWVFFDFETGSAVVDPDPATWDLALRRFHIVSNGGPEFAGAAGVLSLPDPWVAVVEAPADGYEETVGRLEGRPDTPPLARWYHYSFFAHTLTPAGRTYVVRTAEGAYAKFRIVSYYCPEATPGCLTLAYAFQGDGSRRLAP